MYHFSHNKHTLDYPLVEHEGLSAVAKVQSSNEFSISRKGGTIMQYVQNAIAQATSFMMESATKTRIMSDNLSSNGILKYAGMPGFLVLLLLAVFLNEGGYNTWAYIGKDAKKEGGNGIVAFSPKDHKVWNLSYTKMISKFLKPLSNDDPLYLDIVKARPKLKGYFIYIQNTNFGISGAGSLIHFLVGSHISKPEFIPWHVLYNEGVGCIHKNGDVKAVMSEQYRLHDIAFFLTFNHFVYYKLKMMSEEFTPNLLSVYLKGGITLSSLIKTAILVDKSFHLYGFSKVFNKLSGDTSGQIVDSAHALLSNSKIYSKSNFKLYHDRTIQVADFISRNYESMTSGDVFQTEQLDKMSAYLFQRNLVEQHGRARSIQEA